MSAKAIVMGLAHGDSDYDDTIGTIHIDSGIVFVHAGEDLRVSISVDELMRFLTSELMCE